MMQKLQVALTSCLFQGHVQSLVRSNTCLQSGCQSHGATADYRAKKATEDEERAAALVAKAAVREAQRRAIAQVMENHFREHQTAFEARHAVAAEEARMKEDSAAAAASLRRAERATEIERCASFAQTPLFSCKGCCVFCQPRYKNEWQLELLLLV